jgi:hypothetical protein
MTIEGPFEPDGPNPINGSTRSPQTADSERVLARVVPISWRLLEDGAWTLANVGDKE